MLSKKWIRETRSLSNGLLEKHITRQKNTLVINVRGSFSTNDGNGSENVTLKMNSRFFKLFLVYSNSLELSKVGEFPWS